jgi:TetR/AcrR family transcriptional repressor of nem operon
MRYKQDHKFATRERIVNAASRAFRENGIERTGVDAVMKRAGLTHGGFYAHFGGKADLVTEACVAGFESAVKNLERIASLPTPAARVRALVCSYLTPRHRDNVAAGCLVVAVGSEASRLTGRARTEFSRACQVHRERFASALRLVEDPQENLRQVTSLLSLLVGALLMARTIIDPVASGAILSSARRTALAWFTGPKTAPALSQKSL